MKRPKAEGEEGGPLSAEGPEIEGRGAGTLAAALAAPAHISIFFFCRIRREVHDTVVY